MTYTLPDLPYAYDALEPVIDEETMKLHHGKHHSGYVDKTNDAIKGTDHEGTPIEDLLQKLEDLPESIRTTVRNNGGGHYNHSLFWEAMLPTSQKQEIPEELKTRIEEDFGSVEDFKKAFEDAATGQFGSGWAWLVDNNGKLEVESTANQDNPVFQGKTPLLGIDVWEHAYYLNYQNVRADYVKAFWEVVNWDVVAERAKKA